ncbi:unnamed protein product, partial [Eretmochelys imbricata]
MLPGGSLQLSKQQGNTQVLLQGGLVSELGKVNLTLLHCPEGAMAAGSSVESLQDEATCPICLEYFTEPVTLECGHNFCRACTTQCWGESDTGITCPKCRQAVQQRNLRPNRQLANVLEIAKWLGVQAAKGSGVCVEHQKALTLFCEEDQTPICVVCHLSRTHRAHTVVPIREDNQEYKDKIQLYLKILREERENFQGFKLSREKKSQEYLDVRSILSSYEKRKFQQPVETFPEQEKRLSDFSQKTIVLTETLRKFK